MNCKLKSTSQKLNKYSVDYDKYQKISQRVNDLYSNYSDKEPHETNTMTKAMTWFNVEMETLMDHSTSKIAELVVQGTNMGIK